MRQSHSNNNEAKQRGVHSNRPGGSQVGRKLVEITWPTRLTIILIGTSILFSLFFGLEFLVAKVANMLAAQAANNRSSTSAIDILQLPPATGGAYLVANQVNWTSPFGFTAVGAFGGEQNHRIGSNYASPNAKNSKFRLDFDFIYEDELLVSLDRQTFVVKLRDSARAAVKTKQAPIRPDLKLNRLFRAIHIAAPFNPDIWFHSEPGEQLYLLAGNASACLLELQDINNQITSVLNESLHQKGPLNRSGGQNYKLMQLLDSFGRPEAGFLLGHQYWLGSYLECLRLNANRLSLIVNEKPLETRYCVGKMSLNSWVDEIEFLQSGMPTPSFKIGLCLPKSCDSLELFQHLEPQSGQLLHEIRQQVKSIAMNNFNWDIFPPNQLNLTDIYCLPLEEKRQLGAMAFLLLLSLAGWLLFLLLCTWLRYRRKIGQPKIQGILSDHLIDLMAIDVNLRHFIVPSPSNKPTPEVVDLSFLDSIKHIGCMGVVMAHVLLTYVSLGTSYDHITGNIGKDMRTMLMLSLNNVVDTFFVISGLLVAYLTFKRLEQMEREAKYAKKEGKRLEGGAASFGPLRAYFRLIMGRYLRIAPLYMLVYTWAKYMSVHLGSGPMWDYATSAESLRGSCQRESWLWPLAFASDFKPLTQHCVPPAWSLAADFHFFLVLPLFIGVLRHSKRVGYAMLCSLVAISTAYSMADIRSILEHVSHADFANLRLHVFTAMVRLASHAYSQPQNRVGPILVGLMGGHLLFEYERRAILRLNKQSSSGQRNITNCSKGGDGTVRKNADGVPETTANATITVNSPGKRISGTTARLGATTVLPKWPGWMRGNWFKLIVLLSVLLMVAPCLVQMRVRARMAMQMNDEADHAAVGQSPEAPEESWAQQQFELQQQQQQQQVHQVRGPESSGNIFTAFGEKLISTALLLEVSDEVSCSITMGGFALIKPLWAICNCALFLRLATDLNGSMWGRLLSLGWWRPLSKLNYAILLVHFELIAHDVMSRLSLAPTSWPELVCKFAYAYLCSLVLALPIYVLIERPVHRLVSWLLLANNLSHRKQSPTG